MKLTIAVDPGGTTGVAMRAKDGQIVTFTLATMTKTMEGKRRKDIFHPNLLTDLLMTPGIERIVYEDFNAETISIYGVHTVRLCGIIIAIAHIRGVELVRQMPMDRKPYMDDAKQLLKGKGAVVHEIDACAHLLRCEAYNDK